VTADPANDPLVAERERVIAALSAMKDGARVTLGSGKAALILPADPADFARALAENPDATVVAGSTDVGLWVTKFMRPIGPLIFISHLDGLRAVDETAGGVTLGAGVSYTEAFPVIARRFPQAAEVWNRIGGDQVRNMGTIGGNVANGSPIGDTPPLLIALGARLRLRSVNGPREMPIEDFFIDYGKQDRRADEFVEAIHIPALPENKTFAAYKVTKRLDEDITAVLGAFRLTFDGEIVAEARLAWGGMAATPKRAAAAEAALTGKPWSAETAQAAMAALEQDFQPLSDWRASADYRRLVAKNLIWRFWLETAGETVRLDRALAM
jgi:xanthine dehydrogenase small subunit